MLKKVTVIFALVMVGSSVCAGAADKALVTEFITKSGFRQDIDANIRAFIKGMQPEQREKFMAAIDFKKIEVAYADAAQGAFTNAEVAALTKAYEIPEFKSATKKQMGVSGSVIKVLTQEIQNAQNAIIVK
jgi:hypothetical protein